MFLNWLYKFCKWYIERRFTVKCDTCNERFNTQKQVGICPHLDIKEFIYGEIGSLNLIELTTQLNSDKINPFTTQIDVFEIALKQAKSRHRRTISNLMGITNNEQK